MGFLGGFFWVFLGGFFWVGFLMPTLLLSVLTTTIFLIDGYYISFSGKQNLVRRRTEGSVWTHILHTSGRGQLSTTHQLRQYPKQQLPQQQQQQHRQLPAGERHICSGRFCWRAGGGLQYPLAGIVIDPDLVAFVAPNPVFLKYTDVVT